VYIHRYVVGGYNVYIVSSKSAKPGKTITLTAQNWHGFDSGSNVNKAINNLNDCEFSKEEKEREEEKDKKEKKAGMKVAAELKCVLLKSDDGEGYVPLLDKEGAIEKYHKQVEQREGYKIRKESLEAFKDFCKKRHVDLYIVTKENLVTKSGNQKIAVSEVIRKFMANK
jgi:hypothetical protein